MSGEDDFYVGYLDQAPPGLAAFLRPRVTLLVLAALGLAVGLVAGMSPFSTAVFEFGVQREFEGVIAEGPVPTLLVVRPGRDAGRSRFLLTAPGKHGAAAEVAGLDGRRVKLTGTLVHRDDRTMIELVAGTVESLGPGDPGPSPAAAEEDLGVRTLRGEIVDSKCFLGVMKPGHLKPHRACAVRCISGGVPPVLVQRDARGDGTYAVLVGPSGESINGELLDRVAEPVEVTGRLVRRDDLLFLHVDPADVRRLER